MFKINLEKKLIISVGLLIILIAIISISVVSPAVKQIKKTNTDTEELRLFLERRHENIVNLRTAKTKAEEIKENVASFANYFYFAGQELKLITELENLAIQNGVEQKIAGYDLSNQKLKISADISGDYKKIFNYLVSLENLDYFIHVDSVYLSPQENDKNKANMRLNLSLYVNS